MSSRIPSITAAASILFAAACAEIAPTPPAPVHEAARAIAVPAPAVPAEPADPAAFVGRGAREVAEMLGEPRLKRRDPPAELWQYRAERCALDLFLYTGRDNALTVRHAEVRPREAPFAECLERIRNGGG